MHVDQAVQRGPFPAPWALGPGWSLYPPIKPKEKRLFKNPHPQILHTIWGQMINKNCCSSRSCKTTERGDRARVWAPSLPGRAATRNTGGRSPWPDPGPLRGPICCSPEPASRLLGRLALMLPSLGLWLECCAWAEGPLGSQPHPHSSLGSRWKDPLGLPATICPCLSVPPAQRACHFRARDQVTRTAPLLPILGPTISTGHTRGMDPGSQCWQEKETDPRANRRETGLRTLRLLPGGQTGGQMGKESLELGKCRGLLQGLLSG